MPRPNPREQLAALPRLEGKVCAITGPTSGIGEATARGLASLGACVLLLSRDRRRGEQALSRIRGRTGSELLQLLECDLARPDSIRACVETVAREQSRLDVLVNNAAVITRRRERSPAGIELQMAVNHLGPFLLTNLLRPLLEKSAPARVVTVASVAHTRGRLDFLEREAPEPYDGRLAYANSKLCNILFSYELARRWEGNGVGVHCLHPGVIHTGIMRRYSRVLQGLFDLVGPLFFKGPDEGAMTSLHLSASRELEGESGGYYNKCAKAESNALSRDPAAAARLWDWSAQTVGWEEA